VTVRLAGVQCRVSRTPLREPFRTALREVRELEVVEVVVSWSDGSTSEAEVSPTPPITGETSASITAAVTGPLAAAVCGVPLAAHEDLFCRLHAAMARNTTAKCAVDLAVHAALARRVGGWAGLLGVSSGTVATDVTVSLAPPEEMAESARRRVTAGFDVLKLKLGGDVDADLARVRAVRAAVGGSVGLRLDANQAWSVKDALRVLDRLDAEGIALELVEQPVAAGDLAGMAAVVTRTSVPVLADESVHTVADLVRVAEAGAADLVNVKLAKCGGLRAARDLVAVARAHGLGVVVGCMLEPASAVAVATVLARSTGTSRAHDLDAAWLVGGAGEPAEHPGRLQVTAGPQGGEALGSVDLSAPLNSQ